MPSKPPCAINWHAAAARLALDEGFAAAAAAAGCDERTLRRKYTADGVLKALVDCYREAPAAVEEARLGALRVRTCEAIEREVEGGNLKVILWLADRVKLLRPPANGRQDEAALLGSLTPEEQDELAGLEARVARLGEFGDG